MVKKIIILSIAMFTVIISYSLVGAGTCGSGGSTGSNPWTADSASRADVNACVMTHASQGDTIYIPAGTPSWSSPITITKGMYIIGAGPSDTVIKGSGFVINLSIDSRVEISHMGLVGSQSEGEGAIDTYANGSVHEEQIVIHDVVFRNWWAAFHISQSHGVVYDSTFADNEHHGYFEGYPNGVMKSHPAPPWDWDSQHYWVFEDCVFNPTNPEQLMFVTEYPTNYMLRYNTIIERSSYPQIADMHGQSGGAEDDVGVVLYNNNVDLNNDGQIVDIRGGGYSLVYNNTTSGNGDPEVYLSGSCSSQCSSTHDAYIWNNIGYDFGKDNNILGVHYFLNKPANFAELTYPHPLRGLGGPNGPNPPENLRIIN